MTMTEPQAPDWLDIDALTSPELREEIRQMTERLEDFLPRLDALMEQAHDVRKRADQAIGDAGVPGDTYDVLATFTGARQLFDAILALQLPVLAAAGESVPVGDLPEWAQEKVDQGVLA